MNIHLNIHLDIHLVQPITVPSNIKALALHQAGVAVARPSKGLQALRLVPSWSTKKRLRNAGPLKIKMMTLRLCGFAECNESCAKVSGLEEQSCPAKLC